MYRKEVVYDRECHDYAMYLDAELVGFARTYTEAEVTLDQLVFELISGEHFREQHARPAEPAPYIYVDIAKLRRQRAAIASLPAAPSQPHDMAPAASQAPITPGSRQATTLATTASAGDPTTEPIAHDASPAMHALDDPAEAPTVSALWSLIRIALDTWRDFPHATPWDAQLAALDRAIYPAPVSPCALCGSPHPTWHCPEIGNERRKQALGEQLWQAYRFDRDAFIETLRGEGVPLQEWAEALDAYFMATTGRSGGVEAILNNWQSLIHRTAALP